MKKKLLSLFAFSVFGVFSNLAYSQVFIDEDFNTGLGAFTGTFAHDISTNNCDGVGSADDNLWSFSTTGNLTSPTATAAGGDINISFDYKVVDFSSNTPTTGNWGTIVLEHTIDGGGSWTQDTLIDQSNHTPAGVCATVNTVTTAAEVPTGSTVQWRINCTWATGDYDVYVDNFSIQEVVSCPQPTAFAVNNVTHNEVTVGFTDNAGSGLYNFEYGPPGFTQGSGTIVNGSTNNPETISGLALGTAYEIYVQSDCGGGDLSGWTGPLAFTTMSFVPCNLSTPATLPFLEDFEYTGEEIYGDDNVVCSPSFSWDFITADQTFGRLNWGANAFDNNGGTGAASMDVNPSGPTVVNYLELTIDLSNYSASSDLFLSFDWVHHGDENHPNDRVWVRGSNIDTWIEVYDWNANNPGTGIWTEVENLPISTALAGAGQTPSATFQVRFGQEDNFPFGSDGFTFDNVEIQEITCFYAENLSEVNIQNDTLIFDFTNSGTATSFNIEWGPVGFAPGTGQQQASFATNSLQDSVLNFPLGTDWELYVQTDCGGGDVGQWAGPLPFSAPFCDPITGLTQEYLAEDTLVFSYTGTASATNYHVEWGDVGFNPGAGEENGTLTTTNLQDTIFGWSSGTFYDLYVTVECPLGTGPEWIGPLSWGLADPDIGYLTWDSTCTTPFEDISTTGQALGLTDDGEAGITLPFSFQLEDQLSNEITVGNNGGIVFNTLTGQVGAGNGNINGGSPVGMYPYWDDIDDDNGDVYYEVRGTAPNRRAIIQWHERDLFGSAGPGFVTFQVVLFEGSNEYVFVYENVVVGDAGRDNGAGATVGTEGPIDSYEISFNQPNIFDGMCINWSYVTCPMVNDVTITGVNTDSVFFTITPRGNETEWKIEYGPAGFIPGTGMSFIGNSLVDTIPGLDQYTEYDFYVYAACGANDTSMAFGPINFITDPVCPAPSNFQSTYIASDTLVFDWTNGGTETMWNVEYGPVGFTPGTGTMTAFDTNPDTLFGLPDGIVYDFILYADCGGGTTNPFDGPISVATPILNDSTCFAIDLDFDSTYVFSNTGATAHAGETKGNGQTAFATVWFRFISPASGKVEFDLSGSIIDTYTSIYSTSDCGDWSQFVAEGDSDPNTFELCGLSPSTVYYIQLDGATGGDQGVFNIRLTDLEVEAGTAVSTQICAGTAHDLNTSVTGADSSGTWTEVNPMIGLINGTDYNSSSFQAAGIYQVEYRVANVCGYDSVLVDIEVLQDPSAGTDGTISQECNFGTVNLFDGLSGTVDLGGTWYDPQNNSVAGNSVDFNGEAAGQYDYTYVASNGICANDSAVVTIDLIDCTSLTENEGENSISLYPNPTAGIVFINNHGNEDDFVIEVMDMNGKVMNSFQVRMNKGEIFELNMNTEVKGIYFIRIKSSTGVGQHKVVVQ